METRTAAERGGDNLKGLGTFTLNHGSSQGQNLALTVLYVPYSPEQLEDVGEREAFLVVGLLSRDILEVDV